MLIQSASKLTGPPGNSGWAQVHEFTPDDPEKLKSRGHLFVIVSTSHTKSGIDTITAGRELLTRYNEEYYGNPNGKPFNVLRDATQKVADEFRHTWGDVEIVATSFVNNVVYSAAVGGSSVIIFREGSLGKILESSTDQVITASGYPRNNDVILLATKSFFKMVSQGIIKAALSASTPEDSIETLGPIALGVQSPGNLGAAIIKFEEKLETIVPQERVIEPTISRGNFFTDLLKKIPRKNIYLKVDSPQEVSPQSKKMTFTIAAILLGLLAVSIGFGIRQKGINDIKNKYQGILKQATDEVDQAISLSSVSSEKSRELFASSEQKLKDIDNLNVKDSEIDVLRKKINDSRAAILGEYKSPPEMFLDLTLLSSGFRGDIMTFSGGRLYILDKSGQRIVSVETSTKKSKVVAGPGVINSAFALAAYEEKVFVLTGDGIYQVDAGNNKIIDKTWQGDALISAFAGNMYVLDKSGNQVYRYSGGSSGFGEKQNWLATGTNVDFSDVAQITIDGSIYALYPNSKVLKFSQGSPQNFSVKGAFPEIGNIDALYANPDNQYIYLLDKAGGRIVVTDKKGAYKAQYVDDLISSATALIASETDKKIILLTGDKLYSLDTKSQ